MSNRTTVLATVLTLLLAGLRGCANVPNASSSRNASGSAKTGQHSRAWVGFIENRDPSRSTSGATAFLRPSIAFTATGLEAADFASIQITSSEGTSWSYDEAADFEKRFSSESNIFFFPSLYDSDLEGGAYVALGDYEVKATLKNGNTATKTLLVPAPASAETDGYNFAYTESYANAANPPSDYVALPKRATVESATLDLQASNLEVTFSITDDRIYNGWLRTYNAEGEHLGSSDYFRSKTDGVMPQLNSGGELRTDGATNTLSVSAEELSFYDADTSLADVAAVLVVLTDGEQYEDIDVYYDAMSTSSEFDVSVNQ